RFLQTRPADGHLDHQRIGRPGFDRWRPGPETRYELSTHACHQHLVVNPLRSDRWDLLLGGQRHLFSGPGNLPSLCSTPQPTGAPPAPNPAAQSPTGSAPQSPVVFVSTKPAELLHTAGGPQYKTEQGSGLMYIANTDSQVLYNPNGGTVYVLLSGRWFSSTAG